MPWTLALLVLAAALSTAQPQLPPPAQNVKAEELCTIEGTVKHEQTGQPVAKASLLLGPMGGPGQPYASVTDPAGKFTMKGVPPGQYRLSASRAGFVRAEYGASAPGRPGTTLTLQKAQTIKSIDLKLTPHAVITGRVVDSDGEPVMNAQVQALRPSFNQGRRQWAPSGYASTNDLGEYRLFGLASGRYLISAASRQFEQFDAIVDASGRDGKEGYTLTYHPGVAESEQASPVNVPKGGRLQGVDISMVKVKTFSVRGRIVGAPDQTRPVMVVLTPRSSDWPMMGMDRGFSRVRSDGTFEIPGVRPGAYYLNAEFQDAENRMSARVEVDVNDADVTNVSAALQPGFEIKGTVRVEGGGSAKFDGTQVNLQPRTPQNFFFGGGGSALKQDGSFVIRNARPGKFVLRLYRLPDGHYLKAARMGSADALSDDFEVTGAGEIEAVISPNGAKIEGSVRNAKDEPAPGATILLIPVSKGRQLQQSVTADQSGRFTIQGITPGEYNVVAIEDFEYGLDQMPDFLKLHSKFVEKITLREGSAETKTLKSTPLIQE